MNRVTAFGLAGTAAFWIVFHHGLLWNNIKAVISASFFVSSFSVVKMVFPVAYLNKIPPVLVI